MGLELADSLSSVNESLTSMKAGKKRIKVLSAVEGFRESGDIGSLLLVEPLSRSGAIDARSFQKSIAGLYDAVIIPGEGSDELLAALQGHLPLVAVIESSDIRLTLKLLSQGVEEVQTRADCLEGRLTYAVMSAMTRFERNHTLRSIDETSHHVEAKALQTLDRLPFGVMFVTSSSLVLFMNTAAKQACESGVGLYLADDGRCCVDDPDESAMLHRVISRTAEESGSLDEGPVTMEITGKQAQDGLSLLAVPVGSDSSNRGVAIFLSSGGRAFDLSSDTIKSIYGFTGSEALLVIGLVHGSTLAEIAKERGVSLHTVRAQLKSVFSKTGVKRQAELIKQMLTGPAVLVQR